MISRNRNSNDLTKYIFFIGGAAKKKWKTLRENYRKEAKKTRITTRQAAGSEWKSKWTYYNKMSFLQEQFVPRVISGSMGPGIQLSESKVDSPTPDDNTNIELVEEPAAEEMTGTEKNQPVNQDLWSPSSSNQTAGLTDSTKKLSASPAFSTDKRPQCPGALKKTLLHKMIQLQEKKVAEYVQRQQANPAEVQDADYHFLMSLLPSLRAIPAHRKLYIRRKIEDVFFHEENFNTQMNLFQLENTQRPTSTDSYSTVVSSPGQHSVKMATEGMTPYNDDTLKLVPGYSQGFPSPN